MTNPICPHDFVEKYKLIPKKLRIKFLDFLSQISDTITTYDELDILSETIFYIRLYENEYTDTDNYLVLTWSLIDEVYAGPHEVYADFVYALLRCLKYFQGPLTKEDVISFRRKLVMRDILEKVAYRPGNPGYERAMNHFILMSKNF